MKGLNYTKAERLLKRPQFLNVSKFGKKVQNEYFLGLFTPNEAGTSRLGVTVTKKVGNAAVRNRIKRQCREFFRMNKSLIEGCCDIVVVAKKKAAQMNGLQAHSALQHLFHKIQKRVDYSKNHIDSH